MAISHKERLQACLAGQLLDRPPVALWRHFPVDDQVPENLAAATLHYQKTYDWDLVKVSPASSYCLKDWGVHDEWRGDAEGTRQYTHRIVEEPRDWEHLNILSPTAPHLAGQLACLRILRKTIGPKTPIVQTVFNPLSQAKNLAGEETLLSHIRQYPEAVLKGLNAITGSTLLFLKEAVRTGIDGVFFAVQHAQAGLLSTEEFIRFGKEYDLQLLEVVNDLWLNMVHVHGKNIYFDIVASYPVQIINWHDRDTAPALSEAQQRFSGIVCGGLRRELLVLGTPENIHAEAVEARETTKCKRFMLGTGCVVPVVAPHGNLMAARHALEQV